MNIFSMYFFASTITALLVIISFELIEIQLKALGRNGLLPAGIIIAGGGAETQNIKTIAVDALKLPAQLAEVYFGLPAQAGNHTLGKLKDKTWAIASGLVLVGFNSDQERHSIGIHSGSFLALNSKRWRKNISRWISQFLP